MADTDWTASETAALDRVPQYNVGDYTAEGNPYAFGDGGYLVNQMRQANDVAIIGRAARRLALSAAQEAVTATAERQAAQNAATDSYDQAQLSAASAAASAVQAQRLQGTSTTAQTPSIASKTFTTQAGKAFDVGNDVRVQSRSNINRWMVGRVTAYSGTSVTISVIAIGTVVTAASDWDIRIAGTQGVQGIPGIPTMGYSARSSNVQIVRANSAALVDATGTFTQTFDTPANLGPDWYLLYKNAGTGNITIPSSDGVANWIMYPGEMRLFQCDGTTLRSEVVHPFSVVFTASGTFVKPPGYREFDVYPIGGGGYQGGGGAGFPHTVRDSDLPASSAFTVGAGGNSASPDGGFTQFGAVRCNGGGGSPGVPTGGAVRFPQNVQIMPPIGSPAWSPTDGGASNSSGLYSGGGSATANSQRGGNSVFGGGGGCVAIGGTSGGRSLLAGNGGDPGVPGSIPGGGGGAGAEGARGELRLRGVA